ncbi:universal stress protein [Pseudarthrobacter sp. AG30]|jgi:nucleotide-binding universal stress UspA family protein|uniref:universal stress protein n=1 Tax=Micrococcaceae TaxID=1268 RepID=UPI00036442E5|nr:MULTISPECIES: universal stress protein [Micrococcaceae]RAX14960.1 universal stress protein [Pseudarthrobacter sp. AG30]TDT76459.1 nucleotide-binding universal stress UspA family protein [Arthrobacter sp. AG258]
MGGIIVVGVDGSATAKKAAESAKDLAAALGSSLHVVSAFDSDKTEVFGSGSDRWIVSDADAAEQVARTVAESLGRDVTVTYSAARGRPADALIKEALRVDARMIVVGNRRMHGIGRVLGSVANSVAHNAPCDVYIANTYDAD